MLRLHQVEENPLSSIAARDRMIVALDLPSTAEARTFVARLGPAATFYKIGLELVMAGSGMVESLTS